MFIVWVCRRLENNVDLFIVTTKFSFIFLPFQQKAEQMLSQLNNQVQTLPSADAIQPPGFMALESTWDLRKPTRGQHKVEMSQAYVPR